MRWRGDTVPIDVSDLLTVPHFAEVVDKIRRETKDDRGVQVICEQLVNELRKDRQ